MVKPFRTADSYSSALSGPFDPKEVKFKPQSVKGNRAMALAYIDCRVVQDRLDAVLGVEGWMDEYEILPEGSVVCKLRLKLGDDWVVKSDVGSPSEQPDGGDRLKAAFSDALKRAAIKFGIGRYLYRLPAVWADYDPAKRQFVQPPALPAWAQPAQAAQPRSVAVAVPKPAAPLPETGPELQRRLTTFEARLVNQRLCTPGSLLEHVQKSGEQAGYGKEIPDWPVHAIPKAVEYVREFESRVRAEGAAVKAAA